MIKNISYKFWHTNKYKTDIHKYFEKSTAVHFSLQRKIGTYHCLIPQL